jgi:alcohol dehydrogenase class IV
MEANDFSDAFAEKAVQLIFDYLPRAFNNGTDYEAREKVHHASTLAGMAFNMVGLGINHSIAHVCGAHFHIPHGRMNAVLLSSVIEYNAGLQGYGDDASVTAKKYAKLAHILGYPASSPRVGVRSLLQHINQLSKELKMPVNLRGCGVTKQQVNEAKEKISEAALKDACTKTNPRIPTNKEIETILEKIY